MVSSKKIFLAGLISTILIIVAGVFYYYNQPTTEPNKEFIKVVSAYGSMTVDNVDFAKYAREFEQYLNKDISVPEEGRAKIHLSNAINEIDHERATLLLKEVALDTKYPDHIRSLAINWIVNDYELDSDRAFFRKTVFTGEPFGGFLASGDIELAMRRLNEYSFELTPNAIAGYRVAKWYAAELYKNPQLSAEDKQQLADKMSDWLEKADALLAAHQNAALPQRVGLAYELKARIRHLSARTDEDLKMAEESFQKALEVLWREPRTVFQVVYGARALLYYSSFLLRNEGGENKIKNIQSKLDGLFNYLAVVPEPRQRNVRFINFLIAARDSTEDDYPAVDFNRSDIERLYKAYPRSQTIVESLDYCTYIKGHPLERKETKC
jgi:hypothetical protein